MVGRRKVLGLAVAGGLLWVAACAWGQKSVEGLPDTILRELSPSEQAINGTYVLAKEWEAEGREPGHTTGRAVNDAEAQGGKAWEVKVGVDKPLGHVLFGPYLELPRGDYVAFFRLKLLEEVGDELVAETDACVSFGQVSLTDQQITGTGLALNRYVQVPMAFTYPGGKLECRMYWYGGFSFRVDRVALFRLEGGNIPAPRRAPQPIPSGEPKDLRYYSEPRPFPEVFPKSAAPAKKLVVCDLQRQPPDWQLLVLCLQGIVNRTKPQVYCLFNSTDQQWLDWMKKRKWIASTEVVSDPHVLLKRFAPRLKGLVIYDPKLPATKNVATMIAGVEEGVVVSPRLAKELGLPVLEDLRGRWQTSVEAYRWAFDNLWGRLNHHVIACSFPDHLGLRDYLVQHKVFLFWLSGPIDGAKRGADPDREVRLMEQLLSRMPVNIPVMSYPWAAKDVGIGEGPGVSLFAEFGKYLVGSINCSNLSVHSGVRVERFQQRVPPPPRLERDKVYVSLVISDGDNLPVLTVHNFPPLWQDKLRGSFPIGWTISPSAWMLIPDIVDYYYTTATPRDCFLGAVSGVGYTYPDVYGKRFRDPDRSRVFDEFLDQTSAYMQKLDLKALWPMGISRPELIRRYAERIPSLQALFPDYGRRVVSYDEATYLTARGVPVFHAVTGWKEQATHAEQVAILVEGVRSITPSERPAFLHLFVLNWGTDLPMLKEVLKRLGPSYVAVRPDHLGMLCRKEMTDRQALLRVPQIVVGIEGQPIQFSATVQNVSARSLKADLRVTGGLKEASVLPANVALSPSDSTPLRVTGLPAGDRISLEARGAFGVRKAATSLREVAGDEIAGDLPGGAPLRFVRQLEAEQLSHRSGQQGEEAGASGGKVWTATAGESDPGWIVYGPYTPLDKGRYVALFRVRRTGDGDGLLLTLDTCVGGGTPVTSERNVIAEQMPLGQWKSFVLVFDHPGGAMETRVQWSGGASVVLDSISLFELRGD